MYMTIRRATPNDTDGLLRLLSQVLEIHYEGRPDLFKAGAVKYTKEELITLLSDDLRPIYVAVNEEDVVLGYCFCIFKQEKNNNILTDIKTLYIDDLCVDESVRGQHVGSELYKFILELARREGCYNVTLNVWALNDSALSFYEGLGMSPQKIGMEQIL